MEADLKRKNSPLVLLLLDGLGVAPEGEGNVLSKAKIPFFKESTLKYPSAVLSVPTVGVAKKVDPAFCYFVLGGGQSLSKKPPERTLLGELIAHHKKWCLLADPERMPLSLHFLSGKKKIPADLCFFPAGGAGAMSDFSEVVDEAIKRIKSNKWDVLIIALSTLETLSRTENLPNAAMAMAEVDRKISKMAKALLEKEGTMILTSSFGKAEDFLNMKTDTINKELSKNPVPFILIGNDYEGKTLGFPEAPAGDLSGCDPIGNLADVPPTVAKLAGLPDEEVFPGRSLI